MTTRDLYRSMPTPALVLLREAFRLDLQAAPRLTTVAFCERRLRWLDAELEQRDAQHLQVHQSLGSKQAQLEARLDAVEALLAASDARLSALERRLQEER